MTESYSIPNKAESLYVIFTAEITPVTVEHLTAVMVQAQKKRVGEVCLAMSSPGGDVQSGIALYTTLRSMPFSLKTHNIGHVNSMGNVVFLAGDVRYSVPVGTFMFHGVGFDIPGPTRFEEQHLRDSLDGILSDQKRMGDLVVDRTTISNIEVADLFRAQKTVEAPWAKDHGIIEDIRDFEIPPGSPVVSLVFQR